MGGTGYLVISDLYDGHAIYLPHVDGQVILDTRNLESQLSEEKLPRNKNDCEKK